MAKASQRISVIRIPRHVANQSLLNQNHDDTDKNISTAQIKPSELPRLDEVYTHDQEPVDMYAPNTDLFTARTPPISNVQYDDMNQRHSRIDSLKSPVTIHSQPPRIDTWVKPYEQNRARPFLNWKAKGQWTHGLCSVCDDFNMFCFACSCWCCFRHEVSSMMKESWWIWFINCSPLMELRTKFRQQYAIQGSIAEDCCLATCCPLCVALQLANEGREYGHRIFS